MQYSIYIGRVSTMVDKLHETTNSMLHTSRIQPIVTSAFHVKDLHIIFTCNHANYISYFFTQLLLSKLCEDKQKRVTRCSHCADTLTEWQRELFQIKLTSFLSNHQFIRFVFRDELESISKPIKCLLLFFGFNN